MILWIFFVLFILYMWKSIFYQAKSKKLSPPRQQCFSLPNGIIHYLLKNPQSADGLLKLQQTCKVFYHKNQILIVSNYSFIEGKISWYSGNSCEKILNKAEYWYDGELLIDKGYYYDFNKIYRSTIYKLRVIDGTLTFDEFKTLVAEKTVTTFGFSEMSYIKYSNGEGVSIDIILEMLPNVKRFWYFNVREKYSAKTLQKMTRIKMNKKLEYLSLEFDEVSADFNARLLFKFIQQNAVPYCEIKFYVFGEINDATRLMLIEAESALQANEEWITKSFKITYDV